MLRKNRRIKNGNKEERIKVEVDSGAVKELSMKSSKCHSNPLEPEGEQPVVRIVENKMVDNMKSNYLKEVSIQEELKKVKIENYLEFNNLLASLKSNITAFFCLFAKSNAYIARSGLVFAANQFNFPTNFL